MMFFLHLGKKNKQNKGYEITTSNGHKLKGKHSVAIDDGVSNKTCVSPHP